MTNNDLYIGMGDCIDRLSIVNIKMFHLEEKLMQTDNMEERGKIATQLRLLNGERSALKNSLNQIAGQKPCDVKIGCLSGDFPEK